MMGEEARTDGGVMMIVCVCVSVCCVCARLLPLGGSWCEIGDGYCIGGLKRDEMR